MLHLPLNHLLRYVAAGSFHNCIDQILLQLTLCFLFLSIFQPLPDISPQLQERLEVADIFSEIVVQSWVPLFFDFVDLNFKPGFFAGQIFSSIVFREYDDNLPDLIHLGTDQLLFKSRYKGPPPTSRNCIPGQLRRGRLAVYVAGEVDDRKSPAQCRPFPR